MNNPVYLLFLIALFCAVIIFFSVKLQPEKIKPCLPSADDDKTQILFEGDMENIGNAISKAYHPIHIIMAEKEIAELRKNYSKQINPVSLNFSINVLRNQIRERKDYINSRVHSN